MSHHTLSKPNQRATMIRKVEPDEERSILERATSVLNRTADFLWLLFYLLKNVPGAKSLRRQIEDQIEINNDLMDDIEEAKDRDSEEYRKSA